ncbi:hypothetical protein JHD50_11375 [Sulfurimonas sp. MAG313]|nr:hypothetical protein [Sulfurimonas sp. MAG313]MDF1881889.1 hypothetical protein [Sulfurimonas sp. MAG313]
MLNIHDLERRWLRYKIKSYLPLALFTISAISVLIGVLIFLQVPTDTQININETEVKELKKPIDDVKATPIEVPQNTQRVIIHQKKEQDLVLRPSLHFMDNIEDGLNPYYQDNESPADISETSVNNDKQPNYENNQITYTNKPDTKIIKKKNGLVINSNQNEADLKDVIRRFKKNKNPALGLFIAKRYYKLGRYQKSYNYALMTNEINKNIDESWILFSKSLVKLGQHELAMLTLKSYLKSNKSTQAKILLRKIESGSFR